ncbi:isopenicillin N synthase family dioxygenase [Thalassovita taeanensis]|uniref:2-oxoglutarate-dependent ethylene/succinate-forming enzyme n=1 Tax=Thalassovita taeanensis TaxID=657014 RepID=A0A1H9KSQ2_9RHOB|nr:2-oxoglutarate and iron-dependent oxygenase domain-containing protein [Thalassovita taeanensis]SER02190.1 Isopenicillin N synthase [Thalassovita taeanensis]
MIPSIDAAALQAGDPATLRQMRHGAQEVGFLTVHNTAISAQEVVDVIEAYRGFFRLPQAQKQAVDMARTGANRGWGAALAEQVDPDANPDFKQVFDCGFELPPGDPLARLGVYAPNLWPEGQAEFRQVVQDYYAKALGVAMGLLRGIAAAMGEDRSYFDDKFSRPMALLRGNYYPQRPDWAGEKDFGIAAHTDYGCLTLLATDGTPGLEVLTREGTWLPVAAEPGTFIINFGEMLEMWTQGRVVATSHRVKGSAAERISVPLFFNPNHDANVAPMGSGKVILAGEHLSRRFEETYVHLKAGSRAGA